MNSQQGTAVLTLRLINATNGPFADCVDQDKTARNVQSDLGPTLSDEIVLIKK